MERCSRLILLLGRSDFDVMYFSQDNLLPPNQRTSYQCVKGPTGPLNRKQLIEHINKIAMETPDLPELKPYVAGIIRGKKWIPPERPMTKQEEEIAVDLGDEYENALEAASEEELVDLAGMTCDVYHGFPCYVESSQ